MYPLVKRRLSSWSEMAKGKFMWVLTSVWGLIGFVDLFKTELLPEKYQSYTVLRLLGYLSLRSWIIVTLVLLIGVLLEGGHAAIEKRDKSNKEDKSLLEAKIKNKSDLINEMTGAKQRKEAWKRLEVKFQTGWETQLRAEWGKTNEEPLSWTIRGYGEMEAKRFTVVMEEAGQLLLTSQYIRSQCPDILKESNDDDRWLNTVCVLLPELVKTEGVVNSAEGTRTTYGAIGGFQEKCAHVCAVLASKERWLQTQT
jgi:hypothetical protein